jgi:DNA-binding SARP family transcriptional activator
MDNPPMGVTGPSGGGLDFRLLGPVEVWRDGHAIPLGRRQRALLALLVLHVDEVVSTDVLVEELGGSHAGRAPANALQATVSRLRRALGDSGRVIVTRSPGYLLGPGAGEIDVARFERLFAEGRQAQRAGNLVRAGATLREALELWRGAPLADLGGYDFADRERRRLEELRFAAVLERIEADLQVGLHSELVAELESLTLHHPLDQRLRALLMTALYRSGRDGDALSAYQEARNVLVDELGVEPGRELRELQRAILAQEAGLEIVMPPTNGRMGSGLVGRERELAELSAGLDDATHGQGRVYLLAGEPGIGKSRLAEALLERASAAGATVLVGRCWEAGGAPAFWPWVQALRTYVGATDPAILRAQLGPGANDVAQLLPELRARFPDLGAPAPLEPDIARFRLFDALSSFLVAVGETAPVVLLLDDLHAADEPSLLLLEFLARSLGGAKVLVVGAYRDVDPPVRDPLSAALADLLREPVTRRLPLSGLGETDVARFIESIVGQVPAQELVEAISVETQGNPLFVGEIVRLLAAQGRLDVRDRSALEIPQSVRDVVSRRLRQLSPEANHVLALASVLGREFALDLLARLSGLSDDELLDTLDEPVAARVVSDVPGSPDRLRFAHVLIRDTLHDGLSAARRFHLHRLAVAALERLDDDSGARLAELAFHALSGRDFEGGLAYARRAGDRAAELLAFEEAARLYRAALDAGELAGMAGDEHCELLVALGDVQARAGDMPVARESFGRAADLATAIGSTELLARAALGYGGRFLFTRGTEDPRIVELLEQASRALGTEESALRVRVLTRLANAVSQQAPDVADRLTAEAVDVAGRLQDPATLEYAISGRLWATRAPIDLDERGRLACRLMDAGDKERAFEGHILQFIVLGARGDVAGMHEELKTQTRLADELGQPSQRWWIRAHGAQLALLEGRLAEADELIQRAMRLGQRAQSYDAPTYFQLQQFALRRSQGRLTEVCSRLEQTVAGDPTRPLLRCVLAVTYWELGRRELSTRLFEQLAADHFAQLRVNNDWLLSAALLAELASSAPDPVRAESLYRRLVPFDGLNVDTAEVSTGAVARYLGLLAATTGRFALAERHFDDALVMNERMGARPWLAHTLADHAAALLRRGGAGDAAHAHDLLRRAIATFDELGMATHAARTAASMAATAEQGLAWR